MCVNIYMYVLSWKHLQNTMIRLQQPAVSHQRYVYEYVCVYVCIWDLRRIVRVVCIFLAGGNIV